MGSKNTKNKQRQRPLNYAHRKMAAQATVLI